MNNSSFCFHFHDLESEKKITFALQENKNCLFCLYLYTFHFLRLKQKMDSLVFLIKKHNNNKTVRYNDKLA